MHQNLLQHFHTYQVFWSYKSNCSYMVVAMDEATAMLQLWKVGSWSITPGETPGSSRNVHLDTIQVHITRLSLSLINGSWRQLNASLQNALIDMDQLASHYTATVQKQP